MSIWDIVLVTCLGILGAISIIKLAIWFGGYLAERWWR